MLPRPLIWSFGVFLVSNCSLSAQVLNPSPIPRDDFGVTDGPVYAAVETNGVIYVGGAFDYAGPLSGTGALLDAASGVAAPGFPKVTGAVRAVASDGMGGWFIGGQFQSIGGFFLTNLAHVTADFAVDTNWTPNPNRGVLTMKATAGKLFIGGEFTNVSGEQRTNLACLDPATGTALPWVADVDVLADGSVNALALSGNVLYVGGLFTKINGADRFLLGAVDANTGAVLEWFPSAYNTQGANHVHAIAVLEDTLYVGGTFTSITQPPSTIFARNYVAAFDANTAAILPWNPDASGPVYALAASCDTIYVGGAFTNIANVFRNYVAALDPVANQATPWNPNANATVRSLLLAGRSVYLGGMFTEVGGEPRMHLAEIDLHSGEPALWQPRADFDVSALGLFGGRVFAGGRFGSGGELRNNLAAFDVRTGKLLPWNPNANLPVRALAVSGATVYAGGDFTQLGGTARQSLGALDASSGEVLNWSADANNPVKALALVGGTLYAGGSFTMMKEVQRRYAGAVEVATGSLTSWDPSASADVNALLAQGTRMFVGGQFSTIGGQTRRRLAAVNLTSGLDAGWTNGAGDEVYALASRGTRLYVGGIFTVAGGQVRTNLAAFELANGTLTTWNPKISHSGRIGLFPVPSTVNAFLLSDNAAYIGGKFDRLGGQHRNFLGAATLSGTGDATVWNPNLDARVNSLASLRNGSLFAGGEFQFVGNQYRPHFAVFAPIGSPVITLQPRSQQVGVGASVMLESQASGQTPLFYQWQLNGTNISGATSPTLSIASAQPANSGDYSLVVTNTLGLINSRPATLTVIQPLTILSQPISQTVSTGATVTLTVVVAGHPSPLYQWRLNGVNIPGAIYPTLVISNAQPTDGGSYSVVVANLSGAISSDLAVVRVLPPILPTPGFTDNLEFGPPISGSLEFGPLTGNNAGASREPGEPEHAGKAGGKSVWIRWQAPASGIATFSTRGSDFDTLLGVYLGTNVVELTNVVSDEDRGGFLTSSAAFNAVQGTMYFVAVDGFAGAAGNIVLSLHLDRSTVEFPRIINQPVSLTVRAIETAIFSVSIDANTPPPISYQWYFGCLAIPNGTNSVLVIPDVGPQDVGNYRVVVTNPSGRPAESVDAFLEIGPEPKVLSQDKLEDMMARAVAGPAFSAPSIAAGGSGGILIVSLGAIDGQVLNNSTATTSLGEPNHCGVLGGASKWLGIRADGDGIMQVDTIGSDIDTVLAAYSGSDPLSLQPVACNDNGAPDGIRSLAQFEAKSGTEYWVVVDGVNGAKGTIKVNWRFGDVPAITGSGANWPAGGALIMWVSAQSLTDDVTYQWRINGRPIDGATNSTYAITVAPPGHSYDVIVKNFAGTATVVIGTPIRIGIGRVGPAWRLTSDLMSGYVLEGSSNLLNWTALHRNTSSVPSALEFLHAPSPQLPSYFYRVVPWP